MAAVAGSSLPRDYVEKYAPAVKFHSGERVFPCSIEWLMQGGSLNYRTWRVAEQLTDQFAGTPAVAVLNDYIYMIYSHAGTMGKDKEIWVTRSRNGSNWEDLHKIGQQTATPAAAVFNGKLWLCYTGEHSAQLYVTCSADGSIWEGPREISGQTTTVPALTVLGDNLFMVYSSDVRSQLYQTQSSNGWNWTTPKEIPGQGTAVPALTVMPGPGGDQVLMVYPSDSGPDDHALMQSRYSSNHTWTAPQWINGQQAGQVGLTTYKGTAIMQYTGNHGAQLYASSSTDGINWKFWEVPNQEGGDTPALCVYHDRTYSFYSDDSPNKHLYVTSVYKGELEGRPSKPSPTQQDLANCGDDRDYWIDIAESQYSGGFGAGLPSTLTLYYAVQEDKTAWYLHYIFLYAFQHGQTVRAEPIGNDFNTQLYSIGEHPADLERFMVKISNGKDGTAAGEILGFVFEAHGDEHAYKKDDVNFEDGTHAVVSVALNNHSCWNAKIEGDHIVDVDIPGIVAIGNYLSGSYGDGAIPWQPWKNPPNTNFVQLGLDKDGKSVNDQIWVTFQGRMGNSYGTGLHGALHFNGGGLSTLAWGYVEGIFTGAEILGKISSLTFADGPRGPGDGGSRKWLRPL